MRKLLIIKLLLGSLPVLAQTVGPGWKPQNFKANNRDSSYFHKDVRFNSTIRINENALRIGLVTVSANGTELNLLDGALVNTNELNNLVGVTGKTGTGNLVLNNSPTLLTPNLGTPSAVVLTNATGTASGLTAGNVTGFNRGTYNANLTLSTGDSYTITLYSSGDQTVNFPPITTANLAAINLSQTFSEAQTFTGDVNLNGSIYLNNVSYENVIVPYAGATADVNIGVNSLLTEGDISTSSNPSGHGYFNNLTVTNKIDGTIGWESVELEEGDTIPGMFLSEGYDNYLVYNAFNQGILAESFGVTMNTATNTGATMTDGSAYYGAVYIKTADTITGIKTMSIVAGNFTGDNFNGAALYSYSEGVITQVAITNNDESLWKVTAYNPASFAFTSPYYAKPGLYYVGFLYNSSAETTNPKIAASATNYTMNYMDATVYQTSQTSLATSLTLSSATNLITPRWFTLY